jgi:hypothetical protein
MQTQLTGSGRRVDSCQSNPAFFANLRCISTNSVFVCTGPVLGGCRGAARLDGYHPSVRESRGRCRVWTGGEDFSPRRPASGISWRDASR